VSIDLDQLQAQAEERAKNAGDSLSSAVAGLRDRTADVLRADGGSVFRELSRLGSRVDAAADRVEENLGGRVSDVEAALADRLDDHAAELDERLARVRRVAARTSWPRRLFWLLVGAAAGAGIAYLLDPDRGAARRSELATTARTQATQVSEKAVATARRTAHEAVDTALGDSDEATEGNAADGDPAGNGQGVAAPNA